MNVEQRKKEEGKIVFRIEADTQEQVKEIMDSLSRTLIFGFALPTVAAFVATTVVPKVVEAVAETLEKRKK